MEHCLASLPMSTGEVRLSVKVVDRLVDLVGSLGIQRGTSRRWIWWKTCFLCPPDPGERTSGWKLSEVGVLEKHLMQSCSSGLASMIRLVWPSISRCRRSTYCPCNPDYPWRTSDRPTKRLRSAAHPLSNPPPFPSRILFHARSRANLASGPSSQRSS